MQVNVASDAFASLPSRRMGSLVDSPDFQRSAERPRK
jgi:hypothetical protein